MTTETRSLSAPTDMSDPTDRETVLARALLRDALKIPCADVDPGTKHGAKLCQQRLLCAGAEIRRTHDVEHDFVGGRLHHLQLLQTRDGSQGTLHQGHARPQRTVAAFEIVGDAPNDPLHER